MTRNVLCVYVSPLIIVACALKDSLFSLVTKHNLSNSVMVIGFCLTDLISVNSEHCGLSWVSAGLSDTDT